MTNDGGPAFPALSGTYCVRELGMSLRDWFAGMAMLGSIARGTRGVPDTELAYRIADAMLDEREQDG